MYKTTKNDTKDTIIAKLKEDIHRLEEILALLPGHVFWVDRDNVYLGCNNAVARMFCFSSPKDIVGKKNKNFLPKSEAKVLDTMNSRIMEIGESYVLEETTEYNDESKTYLSQKTPFRDSQNNVVGLLGISFDISDRKQMEKKLKEARLKAEISSQVKSDFIRNMEHDIRTPLSGILSVAAHLASIEQEPQKKELLEDLKHASQELTEYFNDIIEISRLSEGNIPIIQKEFDLGNLVKSVFRLELPAAESKGLEFKVIFKENIPQIVIGDSFRTYRILLNLISNAIKFTEKGFLKITVQRKRQSNKKIVLEFSIQDTGIGIPEEDRENIYEKFSCGTFVENKVNVGMGLGLWIVKEFIQDMGGSIKLESELNQGSTFTCILPYALP